MSTAIRIASVGTLDSWPDNSGSGSDNVGNPSRGNGCDPLRPINHLGRIHAQSGNQESWREAIKTMMRNATDLFISRPGSPESELLLKG